MMKNNSQRRSGFTLIEMTVAVAILLTILTIVLVPLRLGLDSFALGRSRTETQGAIGATIADIERDLRRAVKVFPNSELAGVTDEPPFGSQRPYFYNATPLGLPTDSEDPTHSSYTQRSACDGGAFNTGRINNASRIDMILAARTNDGSLKSPVSAGDTLVSYYSRRLDPSKAYDPIDNPVVLFRAEIPFRESGNRAVIGTGPNTNLEIGNARYPADCSTGAPQKNEASLWLAHNFYGEADLEKITDRAVTQDATGNPAIETASHSLAIPRGLGMVVTNAGCSNDPCRPVELGLIPESTFSTFDTNSDGKIDRVNISLSLTTFDAVSNNRLRNNQPVGQQLRASRSVDLPNIR